MVATQVRIIQYLWKMLGCSGEGIPPPPKLPTSVARVRESRRQRHMWVSERFFLLGSPFSLLLFRKQDSQFPVRSKTL